jgi:hypothetical protein
MGVAPDSMRRRHEPVNGKVPRPAPIVRWASRKWSAAVGLLRRTPRTARRVGGFAAGLVLLLSLVSFLADEPIRRSMEREMNRRLTGYSVRLPRLDFRLLGLSVTLRDLTVSQLANPSSPVASIPLLRASVHWRELFLGRLVADFLFERPKIHINLAQLRKEAADDVPLKDRGWQGALQAIYPLKINLFRVTDGDLTYIDDDPRRPLRLRRVHFEANNIRNIHSPERVYPSPVRLEGVIFEEGHGILQGHANFLAKPFPGVRVRFDLDRVPLDRFRPVLARSNLALRGGSLFTSGELEYAPGKKVARLSELTVRGLRIDYVHSSRTAAAEERRAEKVKRTAREVVDKPGLLLLFERFQLTGGEIGFVNEAKEPDYRVFLADADLLVTNLSNRFRRGPARARLRGRFMGSGATAAFATFRPEEQGPDFDLRVAIEETRMTSMNDLLRAYGKFDVVGGRFSLYSELRVRDGAVRGYIKPLFRDLDVYDARQDKEKGLFRRLYEGLVEGVGKLLENQPRDEVATRTEISGSVENPRSSTWQIITRLIQNAFFKAILPGFEREVSRGEKK